MLCCVILSLPTCTFHNWWNQWQLVLLIHMTKVNVWWLIKTRAKTTICSIVFCFLCGTMQWVSCYLIHVVFYTSVFTWLDLPLLDCQCARSGQWCAWRHTLRWLKAQTHKFFTEHLETFYWIFSWMLAEIMAKFQCYIWTCERKTPLWY
jgi:hypothetical protein